MKKKTKIILTVAVVGIIGTSAALALGSKSKQNSDKDTEPKIEYFTLKGSKQVFINGTVTPTRSEEFVKDPSLGKLGDLEVKNGDTVEEGTLLYQYIDPNSEKQIAEIKASIQSTQADRNKAARQMQLDLDKLAAADTKPQPNDKEQDDKESPTSMPDAPLENTATNRESIILQYDLEGFDVRLTQLEQQLNDVLNDQVNLVKAPFKGKVSIPQEKTRDSAILNLTSEDFYVIGEVNEKDVSKLKVDQIANIQTIADKQSLKGKISYISEIPATASTEPGAGGGSSLSSYTVKLALDDAKKLKNGFHVQASIDLDKQKTMVPKNAIHYDNKQAYVLVDDFGTVLKKDISLNKDNDITDKEVEVTDGLESMDKIIVKSDKKLKDGDMLTIQEDDPMDEEAN